MALSRRSFLKAAGAGGALLMARPGLGLASGLGPAAEFTTSRVSRLFPAGTRLAHADLHNHSHLSDGAGDPQFVFASMRDAGLDVAALTDHSTLSWGAGTNRDYCGPIHTVQGEPDHGERDDCQSLAGLTEEGWAHAGELADAANAPHEFTAIRGFEWSSPFLGHINVWFSERWIDPLHTAGIGPSGWGEWATEVPGLGPAVGPTVEEALRANPARTGMIPFYEWLLADPATPGLGGGADGIAGFNHPGREPGRFDYFAPHEAVRDHFVSMEILNRRDDYLFEGYERAGVPSPLVECLNAGWRVGLLGVSDEHGTDWGHPDGKGRAGLWVSELTRAGVAEALRARRFFATNLRGLRVDAAASSGTAYEPASAVRMGNELGHDSGPVTFAVDIDRGPELYGAHLQVQVLRPADDFPAVAHVEDVVVPADSEPVITFTVELDRADGDWVVLRIADPSAANNQLGPEGHPGNVRGLAYASPFWLT